MKISIAIQYYNRKPLLINTLNSIRNTSIDKTNIEIIIVDDASTEMHSIDDIPKIFPDLDIKTFAFTSDEKWWHCPVIPINKSIAMATGDVVVLLCAECMFVGDILEDIQNRIKLNSYLVYSTLSLNEHDTSLLSNMTYDEIYTSQFDGDWYQHSQINNHKFNFCSAIMREDLMQLGGFDERYALGVDYGDADFVLRLERYGIQFVTIDFPYVYHQHHEKFIYTEFDSRVNFDARTGKLVDGELYNYIVHNEPNNIKIQNSFLK